MNKAELAKEMHYKAAKIAEEYVIERGRQVLQKCKSLDELIICMGACFFTSKSGEDIEEEDLPNMAQKFLNEVEDLNDLFNVKGMGIRFRANSKICNNWGRVENKDDLYKDDDNGQLT